MAATLLVATPSSKMAPAPGSVQGKRIAVVGSGISGLSAAYLLHRGGAKVTLFESEAECGGHTLTDESSGYPIDLGFQVYNLTTYPHLVGLFEELGVETEPSEMSFALSVDSGRLEWASHGLGALFAQRRNAARPSFLRMVADVLRFGREAPRVLDPEAAGVYGGMTLGQYLREHGYSEGFVRNYLLPMCACVWSVPNAQVLAFPVTTLVAFWVNHHLLDIFGRPRWRVVKGRSRQYVRRIAAELPDVRTATPVTAVRSLGAQRPVKVEAAGATEQFDLVLLATHTDVSLKLLGPSGPAPLREVLAAIPYNDNPIYLHADEALMPKARKAWASWNFLGRGGEGADADAVCVTYWANRLQHLPAEAPQIFVTLNPVREPDPSKTYRKLTLAHPVFSFASVKAQQRLPEVNGAGGVWLAGAWAGYGFHEDGIRSAVAAIQGMGATVPWVPRTVSPKIGWVDSAAIALFDRFARAAIKAGRLRLVLPNGDELAYGSDATAAPPVPAGDEWRGRPRLAATVRIFSPTFFRKVITRHDTGMGESYMDGDFEVDDLGGLLAVATANAHNIEESRGLLGMFNWAGDRLLHLAHRARPNTLEGSRRNIEEHYDAGNRMYRLFLDDTMTYSCGVWTGPGCDLRQAQLNKLDALIDQAGITADDHVLEIGCGWGSMAVRMAQRTGCRVTGITVSKQQLEEAAARVKAAGLADRVTLLFCDYRDAPAAGTYDKVVSCEMIEAVGQEHLDVFFQTIGAMLKPGGRAAIQAIAEPDERYEAYCTSSDFIREHIFPGGHLPCMGAMVEAARGTGLSVHGCVDIGPDYAVTLRAWRAAWEERRAEVLALGYSEAFWRKYRFYFAYCEAAFDAQYIHTYQITWAKDKPVTLTPFDMQRALERSKHGGKAAAAAPAAAAASDDKGGAPPPARDPLTQLLLAVYFFLAGAAAHAAARAGRGLGRLLRVRAVGGRAHGAVPAGAAPAAPLHVADCRLLGRSLQVRAHAVPGGHAGLGDQLCVPHLLQAAGAGGRAAMAGGRRGRRRRRHLLSVPAAAPPLLRAGRGALAGRLLHPHLLLAGHRGHGVHERGQPQARRRPAAGPRQGACGLGGLA